MTVLLALVPRSNHFTTIDIPCKIINKCSKHCIYNASVRIQTYSFLLYFIFFFLLNLNLRLSCFFCPVYFGAKNKKAPCSSCTYRYPLSNYVPKKTKGFSPCASGEILVTYKLIIKLLAIMKNYLTVPYQKK